MSSENGLDPRNEIPRDTRRFEKKNVNKTKLKWFSFGCLTSIVLLIIFFVVSIVSAVKMLDKVEMTTIQPNSFLNIKLSGYIPEHIEIDEDIFSLGTSSLSARELSDRIVTAALDDKIEGIILEPQGLYAGYSILNELAEALEVFKMTGKPVYAYLEYATNRDYFLASTANEIHLIPSMSSGIFLSGVGVSSLYMKNLFDKLGVEMTVMHCGDYKGVGENYTRNEMSPQIRENYNMIIDDTYQQMLKDIAVRRQLSYGDMLNIYEKRDDFLIAGDEAVSFGLVDGLNDRPTLLEHKGITDKQILSIGKYNPKTATSKKKDHIAVVYLQGTIAPSASTYDQNTLSSKKVEKIIKNIYKDKSIKGIVLRINSPGGSALESEKIYQQIQKLKEDYTVVVSMGDVAASGGYYISAASDYIFADPYTLTGSIGVAALIPNLSKTGKNIGLNSQTIYKGKFTNFLNIWEKPTQQDLNALQRSLDKTYVEFKNRVSEGRNIPEGILERIAQGRVWSSSRAQNSGLVDEIGTLYLAIEKVAELAGVVDYEVVYLPHTKNLLDLILENKFDMSLAEEYVKSKIAKDPVIEKGLQILGIVKEQPLLMLTPITIAE